MRDVVRIRSLTNPKDRAWLIDFIKINGLELRRESGSPKGPRVSVQAGEPIPSDVVVVTKPYVKKAVKIPPAGISPLALLSSLNNFEVRRKKSLPPDTSSTLDASAAKLSSGKQKELKQDYTLKSNNEKWGSFDPTPPQQRALSKADARELDALNAELDEAFPKKTSVSEFRPQPGDKMAAAKARYRNTRMADVASEVESARNRELRLLNRTDTKTDKHARDIIASREAAKGYKDPLPETRNRDMANFIERAEGKPLRDLKSKTVLRLERGGRHPAQPPETPELFHGIGKPLKKSFPKRATLFDHLPMDDKVKLVNGVKRGLDYQADTINDLQRRIREAAAKGQSIVTLKKDLFEARKIGTDLMGDAIDVLSRNHDVNGVNTWINKHAPEVLKNQYAERVAGYNYTRNLKNFREVVPEPTGETSLVQARRTVRAETLATDRSLKAARHINKGEWVQAQLLDKQSGIYSTHTKAVREENFRRGKDKHPLPLDVARRVESQAERVKDTGKRYQPRRDTLTEIVQGPGGVEPEVEYRPSPSSKPLLPGHKGPPLTAREALRVGGGDLQEVPTGNMKLVGGEGLREVAVGGSRGIEGSTRQMAVRKVLDDDTNFYSAMDDEAVPSRTQELLSKAEFREQRLPQIAAEVPIKDTKQQQAALLKMLKNPGARQVEETSLKVSKDAIKRLRKERALAKVPHVLLEGGPDADLLKRSILKHVEQARAAKQRIAMLEAAKRLKGPVGKVGGFLPRVLKAILHK